MTLFEYRYATFYVSLFVVAGIFFSNAEVVESDISTEYAHETLPAEDILYKSTTKITQPPENFEVAAGKSATFRCNAEADPSLPLSIIWKFNDQPIDFDQDPRRVNSTDNSLTITKTIESDSGRYTCYANTGFDHDEASATLTVQDVPNPPVILDVQCKGLIANVQWQPMGDGRAPILTFIIQYNTSFTPDSWENVFSYIPSTDKELKVSMSPWANYTFRVIAQNKIGDSLPSKPSERCSTPVKVPFSNPEKVTGYMTLPDQSLVISWTPMPLIEHNAPGFFYKVFWKEDIHDARWQTEKITDWTKSYLVIENQPIFKPFIIKVEAHNQEGQAHVSATEIIGNSGEDADEVNYFSTEDAHETLPAEDILKQVNEVNEKFYKILSKTKTGLLGYMDSMKNSEEINRRNKEFSDRMLEYWKPKCPCRQGLKGPSGPDGMEGMKGQKGEAGFPGRNG